jgi:beta-galactosidase
MDSIWGIVPVKRCSSLLFACLALTLAAAQPTLAAAPAHFAIADGQFLLDGKPYLIRSGEMHYPRIPRADWRDRMRKARAMGLNTITTYAFWNANEPEPGKFDFSGNLDIAAFIRTAQEEGLNVIVRPGPFICTEWDFGGMPAWLLRTPGLRVRSYDPRFLKASAAWFKRLHQELAPLLSTRGGPVLMMQVENEYGYAGEDHDYLDAIRRQMVDAGFDLPLFTSNGPGPTWLQRGTLPDMLSVINFDGDAAATARAFKASAPFMQGMPKMAGEYWDGWYDRWGGPHNTRDPAIATGSVSWFLDNNVSFNLYMVDGGTNFGWMAGANNEDYHYTPLTTSYDYDSPIDEAGRLTPKYYALRKVIQAHLPKGERLPEPPPSSPTIAIGRFDLTESVSLLDALPALAKPLPSLTPHGMEAYGQNYGLILYRKKLDEAARGTLEVRDVRDYATVLADGKPLGTLDRRLDQHAMPVDLAANSTLDLIVENMGRINVDALADEYKGITYSVKIGPTDLTNWSVYPLPLDNLSGLHFSPGSAAHGPAFWHGSFNVAKAGGSFLDMRGWTKGNVWVNGHHLGRYWAIGPQQSLYVPAVWLHTGRNDIVVLEMQEGGSHSVAGMSDPIFETPQHPAPVSP